MPQNMFPAPHPTVPPPDGPDGGGGDLTIVEWAIIVITLVLSVLAYFLD